MRSASMIYNLSLGGDGSVTMAKLEPQLRADLNKTTSSFGNIGLTRLGF